MAQVQVVQSNARVAAPVECGFVPTRNGETARARVLVISNDVRRKADPSSVEKTVVWWTVWGRLAETASRVLVTGSHVNVSGHLRNVEYRNAEGSAVQGFELVAQAIDFLETKQEATERRARLLERKGTPVISQRSEAGQQAGA